MNSYEKKPIHEISIITKYGMMASLIVLSSCTFSSYNNLKWSGLIIGFVLTIISIVFHLHGKSNKRNYFFSYLLNTIGTGFSISTYYTVKNIEFSIINFIIPTIILGLLFLITMFLTRNRYSNNGVIFNLFIILQVMFMLFMAIMWINNGNIVFYSYSFLIYICLLFYIILGNLVISTEINIYKEISVFSYGVYIIITTIVLAVLSDGNIDGIDLPIFKSKKK